MTDATPLLHPTVHRLGEGTYELGEGARVVAGQVVHVDLLAGRLLAHPGSGDSEPEELLHLDVPLGAVAPVTGAPGEWIAAAGDGLCRVDADGAVTWLGHPEAAHGGATRMNDGVCDTQGRFWAVSMDNGAKSGLGSLYRVEADGTVVTVLGDLVIGNGPAVSADGRWLFLADTPQRTITRYALGDDGSLSAGRVVVRTQEPGAPDGMTTDQEGTLWVAVHGAGEVHRYSEDGELLLRLALPASQPTSVALLEGALVVTTAWEHLAEQDRGEDDGRLLRVELPEEAGPAGAVPVRSFG